jgi:hypothetical protein
VEWLWKSSVIGSLPSFMNASESRSYKNLAEEFSEEFRHLSASDTCSSSGNRLLTPSSPS